LRRLHTWLISRNKPGQERDPRRATVFEQVCVGIASALFLYGCSVFVYVSVLDGKFSRLDLILMVVFPLTFVYVTVYARSSGRNRRTALQLHGSAMELHGLLEAEQARGAERELALEEERDEDREKKRQAAAVAHTHNRQRRAEARAYYNARTWPTKAAACSDIAAKFSVTTKTVERWISSWGKDLPGDDALHDP
jgi:Ca2+/Na+ antiporter